LRPGTQNPLIERSETNLGRFGLGLKTASFSQCRKLSVMSKCRNREVVFWSWDLDYVTKSDKWEILQWVPQEFESELDTMNSGTVVIWSDLDRIVSPQTAITDESAKIKFSNSLDRVKRHLAMTFHRFIEENAVKIFWGDHEIEAWNPFYAKESKTQEQPIESIIGGIKVKGYILPHKNNFSSEKAYKEAEGLNGYPAMQGFYVYRGKRLLLAGDWLGLFRKEEHYKLVRIQIDIPNNLDTEWLIDIKKSKAHPPEVCKEQLIAYAKSVRNIGVDVYRHRGKILKQKAGSTFQPIWLEKKKDNKWSFVVNREHLMIQHLKHIASEKPEYAIDTLLRFIEESVPTSSIYINKTEDKEEHEKLPFSDIDINTIKQMLIKMFENQVSLGKTPEQAKILLKTIEPFNNYEDLIEGLE